VVGEAEDCREHGVLEGGGGLEDAHRSPSG
jgi:hypothetical protein